MKSSSIIHPLLIFFLAFVYIMVTIYFGYNFLLAEELYINNDQRSYNDYYEDYDGQSSWIKQTLLTPLDHPSQFSHQDGQQQSSASRQQSTLQQRMFSQPYSIYLYLDEHCQKTIQNSVPKFDKFVLFIIDALRVDFIKSLSKNFYSNTDSMMPYTENVLKTNGIGLVSVASIPTVTLPRIKSLISGTLPSFMDYFLNLNTFHVPQSLLSSSSSSKNDRKQNNENEKNKNENIVQQFRNQGKRIVFYGDDTWSQMLSDETFHRINVTSSLFATDYTEVDTNVTYNVLRDLKQLNDWDAMILHYLGVDHIGHLRGYNSDLFPEKFHEMDSIFRQIFDTLTYSIDNDNQTYLIVITGDHGMTNSGNHGGDTVDETHTALMFISTNRSHHNPQPSFSPNSEKVLQIDFASTISSLFGLKFPFKNQGRLISSVLERFQMPREEHLCYLFRNALQTQKILNDKNKNKRKSLVEKKYFLASLSHHWDFLRSNQSITISTNAFNQHPGDGEKFKAENYEKAKHFYHQFIKEIQNQFVHRSTDRSFFSTISLAIFLSFLIVSYLLYMEIRYHGQTSSILFRHFTLTSFAQLFNGEWIQSCFTTLGIATFKPDHPRMANISTFAIFLNLRYSSSLASSLLILSVFIMKYCLIGSVNFMLNEHYFWYYVGLMILTLKLLISIRGYLNFRQIHAPEIKSHLVRVILAILVLIVTIKLLSYWKMPILNDSDLQFTSDMSNFLLKTYNKRILSSLFICSLILIGAMVTNQTPSSRSHYFLIASLIWIYLYRSQMNQVTVFKLPLLNELISTLKSSNFYAKIVYLHCFLILMDSFCIKFQYQWLAIKKNVIVRNLLRLFPTFNSNGSTTTDPNRAISHCTFLYTFNTIWLIMSCLLLEPSLVAILMMNILMEKLANFILSSPSFLQQSSQSPLAICGNQELMYNQLFYRLGFYIIMANCGFYQLGNRNSLSTISVNSCFTGLNSYIPWACGLFMTISIYSTFIFWLIMFFIRLHEDLFQPTALIDLDDERVTETATQLKPLFWNLKHCNHIVKNYQTFCSIINWILILQYTSMSMDMLITLILRDHLFIWSVICPKFIYEFCFTIVYTLFTFLIYIFFTLDNCFMLDNVKKIP